MKKGILLVILLLLLLAYLYFDNLAYEREYDQTAVDDFEIKTIPAGKQMITRGSGNYFALADSFFMRLFRYIQKNKVSMTVPVESDLASPGMRFYIGPSQTGKDLTGQDAVEIASLPERRVASLGCRGDYTEANVVAAVTRLQTWVQSQADIEAAGPAYAVFWNGPFRPGFLKRFELHLPIRKR